MEEDGAGVVRGGEAEREEPEGLREVVVEEGERVCDGASGLFIEDVSRERGRAWIPSRSPQSLTSSTGPSSSPRTPSVSWNGLEV